MTPGAFPWTTTTRMTACSWQRRTKLVPRTKLRLVVLARGGRVLDEVPVHRVANEPDAELSYQRNALLVDPVHPDPQFRSCIVDNQFRRRLLIGLPLYGSEAAFCLGLQHDLTDLAVGALDLHVDGLPRLRAGRPGTCPAQPSATTATICPSVPGRTSCRPWRRADSTVWPRWRPR